MILLHRCLLRSVRLAVLEPLASSDVRLHVNDPIGGWFSQVRLPVLFQKRVEPLHKYLACYASEPERNSIPSLRVLPCGRPAKLPVVGKLLNVGSSSFVTLLFGRHCGQLRGRDASSISRASTPSCCRVLSSSTARCLKLRDNAGAMWISMPFLPIREGRVAAEGVERLARSSAVSRLDLAIEG